MMKVLTILAILDAGFVGWKGKDVAINAVEKTLNDVAGPFLVFAQAILGLVFVKKLVETVRAHQAGEGDQGQIIKFGILLIGSILVLQLIKVMFFN